MKLRLSWSRRMVAAALVAALLAGPAALAADQPKVEKQSGKQSEPGKNPKPLSDKENPLMIGKRDINKGSINFYSAEKELNIGRRLAAEINARAKFVADPVVNEYVNRVGQNIVLRSDAKIPFTIKLIDAPEVNAFALPGGFLYVNSGLLLAADSEAELAGVMAHEIAHITARHGVEQASKGALFQYLSIPLVFVGGVPGLILQNVVNIAVPLTFLKFSRGAEEEADRLGLQYMWNAGYDPMAMTAFFEKLKRREGKEPGTLAKVFSTHPATGKRLEKALALLSRFPERDEYTVSTSEFRDVQNRMRIITAHQSLAAGERAAPTLRRKPKRDANDESGETGKPTLRRRPPSDN